jgi:fatty acid desaturase
MQASYFVIKSSHSGTPILSPAAVVVVVVLVVVGVLVATGVLVVVVVVVVAVLLPVVVLEELVVESEPPQAANRSAQARESDRETENLFNILEILLKELRGNRKAWASYTMRGVI